MRIPGEVAEVIALNHDLASGANYRVRLTHAVAYSSAVRLEFIALIATNQGELAGPRIECFDADRPSVVRWRSESSYDAGRQFEADFVIGRWDDAGTIEFRTMWPEAGLKEASTSEVDLRGIMATSIDAVFKVRRPPPTIN